MDRRNFVRLVGGGIVAPAATLGAGCSGELPAAAIEGWSRAGQESDLRRWLLSYALLAPHSHNLQSWLVDLRTPDTLVLYCDRTRLLPKTDPLSRQILMSQGTFLELLDLAARERGQRADITLFPEGVFDERTVDDRPVARIRLQADAQRARDPLFGAITRRHTNRNAYDAARPVPDTAWQAMAQALRGFEGLSFGHTAAADPALPRHRAIADDAWQREMRTPGAMLETFHVLRVGAREIEQHRDGLSVTSPFVVAMTRLGLFDRSVAPAPDSYAIRQQIDDFARKIASTPSFLWIVSEGNARTTQVAAGRAYARVQLAATAHGVVMQPLQQALQEYPEVAAPYAAIRELLQAPAPQRTVQMWARVGFAEPVAPAPRRRLDDLIRKA
jgi:hypothetical protein